MQRVLRDWVTRKILVCVVTWLVTSALPCKVLSTFGNLQFAIERSFHSRIIDFSSSLQGGTRLGKVTICCEPNVRTRLQITGHPAEMLAVLGLHPVLHS